MSAELPYRIAGVCGEKLVVQAQARKGEANRELLRFLAKSQCFFTRRPAPVDSSLAVLLLGPIILDTANLDPAAWRAAEKNRAVASCLRLTAG